MARFSQKILFVVLTVLFGAFAGAFAWAFFFLMNNGISLLWDFLPNELARIGVPTVVYPVAVCGIGGILIGLFTRKYGDYPQDMNTVMAEVKKTGRYEYESIGPSFFGALLPLLFGGSIGPEAGLTGVIAGLCTWVGDRLRFVGEEMRELAEASTGAVISAIFATPLFGLAVPMVGAADESDGKRLVSEVKLGASKPLKTAVYVLAAAGALATVSLLGLLFGANGGLPHYSDLSMGYPELIWAIPLALVGALAGWLYFPFGVLSKKISSMLGEKTILKPVIAGVVLGAIGIVLPFAMFAGEAQTEEIAQSWTSIGCGVLIATGFIKIFTTRFCLEMGWRGGHFFPVIFAGISIGYGFAALMGIDPVFSLCVVTAALVGSIMRQPVMCVLLLFLVFPVKGVFVLLAAACVGSLIPVPKKWL